MKRLLPLFLFLFLLVACTPTGESIVNGSTDVTQYYTYDKGEDYAVGPFAQTTEEIEGVNVNWIHGSVTIKGEDRAGITVRENYRPKSGFEPYSVHTYIEDKTLYVRFMHCNLQINTSIPTKELTIVVPKELLFKKITVSTGTARAFVSDIKCDDFAFDSGGIGADLRTEQCTYKSFFSNITTGDTIIKDCTFSEKTEFIMGTGSVIAENSRTVLLQGQCRTGDLILLDTEVKKADVNVSLTGDCYFTDLICEDFSVVCTAGNFYVHLSPDMDEYTLQAKSPFQIVYPEDMPEEGEKSICLKTTTGRIKFLEKEEIERMLRPTEE